MDDADLERLWRAAGKTSSPTPLELWTFRRKLPLLIRLPGGAAAGSRDTAGGHLDIAPTLLALMGADDARGPWLGRDLTAAGPRLVVFRDGTVTDGRAIARATEHRQWACTADNGRSLPCERLEGMRAEGQRMLQVSDQIIRGNLSIDLTARLGRRSAPVPRTPERIWVVAHRGNSIHYPENTLAAMRSAFDLGADAVELDIRLSRDGVPVVFHDDTLERTTNGKGPVDKLTVAELKRLDAGKWMDDRFAGTRIPTLEEALRETRGRGSLLLDLKSDGLGAVVAQTYLRVGVPFTDALIAAGSPDQRADFLRHMPHARVLMLEDAPVIWDTDFFHRLSSDGAWGLELGEEFPPDSSATPHAMDFRCSRTRSTTKRRCSA